MTTQKPTILVVDDDPDICLLLRDYLKPIYTVETCTDIDRAIDLLTFNRYSLILTDLYMHGWRGIDVIDTAKEQQPGIPIIVITGDSSESALRRQAIAMGIDGILHKPLGSPQDVMSYLATFERKPDAS